LTATSFSTGARGAVLHLVVVGVPRVPHVAGGVGPRLLAAAAAASVVRTVLRVLRVPHIVGGVGPRLLAAASGARFASVQPRCILAGGSAVPEYRYTNF
jgi:hypothetical protein